MPRHRLITGAGVVLLHVLLLAVAVYAPRVVDALQPPVLTVSLAGEVRRAEPAPPRPRVQVTLVAPGPIAMPVVTTAIHVAPEPAAPLPSPPAAEPAPAQALAIADLELQCPQRRAPMYPVQAKREREQGDVRLLVSIDEEGRIEAATVVASSGSRRLDDAAREAILQWRCDPARQRGQAVRATAYQTLSFVLTRR